MKKLLVVVLVIAIALIMTSTAMAAIRNSKHDLSSTSTTTGPRETTANLSACQFCHTPHLGANPVVTGAPLWNRSISAAGDFTAAGGGTYHVYGAAAAGDTGQTLATTQVNAPGPNSKTCLSCHDGTLGLGTVLVGTSTAAGGFTDPFGRLDAQNRLVNGLSALGTDLRQEHPVGLTVTPGRAGLDTIVNMQTAGAKFYGAGTDQMECASCHDPHGTDSVYGGVMSPFLRMDRSTMCTDCHVNK